MLAMPNTPADDLVRFVLLRTSLPAPAARRRIREAGGLAQADVAHALGVTAAAVARWEDGSRTPRRAHLVAYARLLERLERAVDLFSDEGPGCDSGALAETSMAGQGHHGEHY